jgi:hypothetical protein
LEKEEQEILAPGDDSPSRDGVDCHCAAEIRGEASFNKMRLQKAEYDRERSLEEEIKLRSAEKPSATEEESKSEDSSSSSDHWGAPWRVYRKSGDCDNSSSCSGSLPTPTYDTSEAEFFPDYPTVVKAEFDGETYPMYVGPLKTKRDFLLKLVHDVSNIERVLDYSFLMCGSHTCPRALISLEELEYFVCNLDHVPHLGEFETFVAGRMQRKQLLNLPHMAYMALKLPFGDMLAACGKEEDNSYRIPRIQAADLRNLKVAGVNVADSEIEMIFSRLLWE